MNCEIILKGHVLQMPDFSATREEIIEAGIADGLQIDNGWILSRPLQRGQDKEFPEHAIGRVTKIVGHGEIVRFHPHIYLTAISPEDNA